MAFFAVDRVEGAVAVLVGDNGATVEVVTGHLPKPLREGTVLRVVLNDRAEPDWTTAQIDEVERERRLDRARDALTRLRKRDPGGDIQL